MKSRCRLNVEVAQFKKRPVPKSICFHFNWAVWTISVQAYRLVFKGGPDSQFGDIRFETPELPQGDLYEAEVPLNDTKRRMWAPPVPLRLPNSIRTDNTSSV
jgi:hypothetical protein